MDGNWPATVLDFWFAELGPQAWFTKDEALDASIRSRFLPIYGHVSNTATNDALTITPETALAALITLDQFPRNMFRGSARMFDSDPKALQLAQVALAKGFDQKVDPARRLFFYLPFEHSEAIADQERSVVLFEKLGNPHYIEFALAHRDIIARFGRFPHRNAILGRRSSPEELDFLAQPGSGF